MRAFLIYSAIFILFCGLDFATTCYGVATGAATELNELVADQHGSISSRFIVMNLVLCLVFGLMFARGWAGCLHAFTPDSWTSYFAHLARGTSKGFVYAGLAVLITRALVPISNISAILFNASLPSLLRPIVGTGSRLMWSTIVTGILFGVLLAKPLSTVIIGRTDASKIESG